MKPYPSIAAVGDRIGAVSMRHIDLAFRRIMPGTGVEVERAFVRLVTGEPHPFGNFACLANQADLKDTRAAIEPLRSCPAPSAVLFTGPVPEGAPDELAGAGFQRHGGLPAMAVEIAMLSTNALPAGYTIVRVRNRAQRDAWGDVFARGYGLPLQVGAVFARGIDEDERDDAPVQYFWILKDGRPVNTSMLYLNEGVAGIYGVATLAEERGKGLGAFATVEPLKIAYRFGYRVGVLQASEDGHPVYRRIGFADFGEVPLYVRMPG